ncbi:hypothetical protein [uncultured Neptuniibacter sp.]|uniref:hypothetical protein n=1 Tax=uncultured Neptuniibacter sp. TaxID=502143 RepID=UPI002613D4FC|nr:hypothetical protein [uncultured Neptuniibacter sp.]
MMNNTLKTQLKQLLKRGYSEHDVRNLAIAPKQVIDQAINEFHAEQRVHDHTLQIQHNQASFAMRLGG